MPLIPTAFRSTPSIVLTPIALSAAALLSACGGGDDSSDAPGAPVAATAAAPVIAVDAAAVSVVAGGDATFSVTASGSALAYQWQQSTDGTTYTNLAGATAATLTLPAVAVADSGKTVRVAVTNSAGTVTSAAAALYVTPAIADATIVSSPTGTSVVAPAGAIFTVIAAGTPAPAYQWQSSADNGTTWADIAGATAASYTTGATAVADSGKLFRVRVVNATATVVSDPATLSVVGAAVPVAITTQPRALSVTVPATATFTVAATGSPTPTYQWQVKGTAAGATFVDITGATAASYTTPATVASDSGKQFQVVVTNGSGSVTSAAATLTATSATTASVLAGRAWTTGQPLETGDATVVTSPVPLVEIDDTGNAISVFNKSDGTRNALYATRGVPGAAGATPVWSAPVVIDTAAAPAGSAIRKLTVAPNGDAVVTWLATAPCTATTYKTNGTCNFLFSSRYSASANSWSAAAQLVDIPYNNSPPLTQLLNSRGDFAILSQGVIPGANTSYSSGYAAAVVWRAAGQTGVQKRLFSDVVLRNYDLGLDKDGNLLLAGDATQNATTDIVAYRGTTTTGFGAQELLEQRSAAATFEAVAVGLNGQAIVTWTQSNGTAPTHYAADITTPAGAWRTSELEQNPNTGSFPHLNLTVADNGDGFFADYSNGSCKSYFFRLSQGAWSAKQPFPAAFPNCNSSQTANRNGDLMVFNGAGWTTYAAASNSIVRLNTASASSVYGTSGGSLGTPAKALSVNGIGVIAAAVPYDTLPTVAQPAGDGRSSVINLWGLFLK